MPPVFGCVCASVVIRDLVGGGKAGKNDVVNKCNKTIKPAKFSLLYQKPYINHKKSV